MPIVIAHRGASGHRPEHTLEAYDLGITMGADFIEPDVVSTRDGVLVTRHENEIGETTDVAERFPDRKRVAVVDGSEVEGWFVEDFTLSEIRQLRARERLPTRSHEHDGKFVVPTLDEVLDLVARREAELGRRIGIYPETKHPTYFRSIGLPLEEKLLATLTRHGYANASDPVFIQSFETGNLRDLSARTELRLIQLIAPRGTPPDLAGSTNARQYVDLITPAGLADIATYAAGVGVEKSLVIAMDSAGVPKRSTLVEDAHRAGLLVHVWTLRSDATFLPAVYAGDAGREWTAFLDAGVDGAFGDFPDAGVAALAAWAGRAK